jgi:hypothetical protein
MALRGYENAAAVSESGTDWTGTLTDVLLSNDTYVSYNSTSQEYLIINDWFDTIPLPDWIILRGIEVSIEGNGDGGTAAERTIEVGITDDGGTTEIGTPKTLELNLTTDTVQTLGGATDLWGITNLDLLDVGELNAANFGIRIRKNTATANNIDLDHVMLRVYYDYGVQGAWDFDDDDDEVLHIDGYLDYDGGSGTAPVDGDVVRDQTTGAVGLITFENEAKTAVFGTLQLSDIHTGLFGNNNTIDHLEWVDFDNESNGGINEEDIGSTLTGATSTRTGVIYHVRPSIDGVTGVGRVWGLFSGSGGTFTDDETLNVTPVGGSPQARATANGTGSGDLTWTGVVNGTLIEHTLGYIDYDTQTVNFEAFSGTERLRGPDSAGLNNFIHNMCVRNTVDGETAMVVADRADPDDPNAGRLWLTDFDGTTGWDPTDTVEALTEISYTGEQNGGFWDLIGQADEVEGATSGATATLRRVIANDTTGTLYVSGITGGPFTAGETLRKNTGDQARGTMNGVQRDRVGSATIATGGGLVTTGRTQWLASHIYTASRDREDELVTIAAVPLVPLDSDVQDQRYKLINSYRTSYFSTRYIQTGAVSQNGAGDDDEVFTNYASSGSLFGGGAVKCYVERDGAIIDGTFHSWDDGYFDALVRNKSKGAKIDGGTVTWFARPYGELFDWQRTSQVGGVAGVGLNTFDDGQITDAITVPRDNDRIRIMFFDATLDFDTGSGTVPAVGDVLMLTDGAQINHTAMVMNVIASASDDQFNLAEVQDELGARNTEDWADGSTIDVLTEIVFDGQVTAGSFVVGTQYENSGDTSNIVVRRVEQIGGAVGRLWVTFVDGTVANWADGETIHPNGGGAALATVNGNTVAPATWTGLIDDAGGGFDSTPTTFGFDIDDNDVDENYAALAVGNLIRNGQTGNASISDIYHRWQFLTRDDAGSSTDPGTLVNSLQGRRYISAKSTYAAKKQGPLGTKPGSLLFLAQGIALDATTIAAADVQNFEALDDTSATITPPNNQSITVAGGQAGLRLVILRLDSDDGPETYDEFTAGVAGAGFNEQGDTQIKLDQTITKDHESSGYIIHIDTTGPKDIHRAYAYSSFSGVNLVLSEPLTADITDNDELYIPLVFEEMSGATTSATFTYLGSPIYLRAYWRLKGTTKPQRLPGTYGPGGASFTLSTVADSQVE